MIQILLFLVLLAIFLIGLGQLRERERERVEEKNNLEKEEPKPLMKVSKEKPETFFLPNQPVSLGDFYLIYYKYTYPK